jgi:hypothetical protein
MHAVACVPRADGRARARPTVEAANRDAPAVFARIPADMVLVACPGTPLPRAAQGTVNRKAVLVLYDAEIRTVYAPLRTRARPSLTVQQARGC